MRDNIPDLCCQTEEFCRFCYPPEKERILYYTEHFYVMVSLGPIVEGYILIISKKHIGACLQLPKEYLNEYYELKKKVKNILTSVYGSCIFFEHGKTGSCMLTGKDHIHCFHAHLHCIPVDISLNSIIEKELSGTAFNNEKECFRLMQDVDKYLYVEDNRIMTYQPTESLRSQYLRYKLANALNLTERWSWVNNQNWSLIDKTITKLKPYFDEKY